jgi:Cytochrome P460
VPSEENNKVFGQDQSFVPGTPTNIQFMVKDTKKYAATGGWGFTHFQDGKPGDEAMMKTCFPGHNQIKTLSSPVTRPNSRYSETMAYFAAVAAFSINLATSRGCERKIAWLPGSSMTCDCARFVMNRSRSGLIIRSCLGITA